MNKIKIGNKPVGPGEKTFIVAEIGINHNGSVGIAKKMIAKAKSAGADAVKFQSFTAERLVSKLQEPETCDFFRRYQLSMEQHKMLFNYAKRVGIEMFSTPFDANWVDFLEKYAHVYKVASGDLTNLYFLSYIARKKKPIIISTGYSCMEEIRNALDVVYRAGNRRVVLMHCTANYPAEGKLLNLKAIPEMERCLGVNIGYSDHSSEVITPAIAVAVGACLIEKHFTLDNDMRGPDHKASLNPEDFRKMSEYVRFTEDALGDRKKRVQTEEQAVKKAARRSIAARNDIFKGQKICIKDIDFLRPGNGIPAERYKEVLGKVARRKIAESRIFRTGDIY